MAIMYHFLNKTAIHAHAGVSFILKAFLHATSLSGFSMSQQLLT